MDAIRKISMHKDFLPLPNYIRQNHITLRLPEHLNMFIFNAR